MPVAVFAAVALAVAGPDLVTLAEVARGRARRGGVSVWWLPGVVAAAHGVLVVAHLQG